MIQHEIIKEGIIRTGNGKEKIISAREHLKSFLSRPRQYRKESIAAAGAAKVCCAVLGVNQLPIDYWLTGSALLYKFSQTYRLSMNAGKRLPFFSRRNGSGTISYEDGINHELSTSQTSAAIASDDDEF